MPRPKSYETAVPVSTRVVHENQPASSATTTSSTSHLVHTWPTSYTPRGQAAAVASGAPSASGVVSAIAPLTTPRGTILHVAVRPGTTTHRRASMRRYIATTFFLLTCVVAVAYVAQGPHSVGGEIDIVGHDIAHSLDIDTTIGGVGMGYDSSEATFGGYAEKKKAKLSPALQATIDAVKKHVKAEEANAMEEAMNNAKLSYAKDTQESLRQYKEERAAARAKFNEVKGKGKNPHAVSKPTLATSTTAKVITAAATGTRK